MRSRALVVVKAQGREPICAMRSLLKTCTTVNRSLCFLHGQGMSKPHPTFATVAQADREANREQSQDAGRENSHTVRCGDDKGCSSASMCLAHILGARHRSAATQTKFS